MTRTERRRLLRLLWRMTAAMATGAAMARPALAAPALPPPALRVPGRSPAAVQQALLDAITQLPDQHPRRQRYRLALAFDAPLFPPDHLLRDPPIGGRSAALDAWLALPHDQRLYDVLILPDEDYYWREPGAVEYSAQFLLHLVAGAAGATLLILQLHARRRYGKTFQLLGRTGPGWYWDIRPAPASPAAATALADDLAQWLGATRQVS